MKSCFGQVPCFPHFPFPVFSTVSFRSSIFLGLYNIYKRLWSCTSTFLNLPLLSCPIMQISVNKRILRIPRQEGGDKLPWLQENQWTYRRSWPAPFSWASDRTLSHDCDHSFCQACNTANNNESHDWPRWGEQVPCIQNQYEPGNLQPHWHLASIVEWLREVKVNLEEQRNLSVPWRESPALLWGGWQGHLLALQAVSGTPWSPHIPYGGCPEVPGKRPEWRKHKAEMVLEGNVYFALDFDNLFTMNLGLVISLLHLFSSFWCLRDISVHSSIIK